MGYGNNQQGLDCHASACEQHARKRCGRVQSPKVSSVLCHVPMGPLPMGRTSSESHEGPAGQRLSIVRPQAQQEIRAVAWRESYRRRGTNARTVSAMGVLTWI